MRAIHWLNDLKLRTKLAIGFGAVILLTAATGWLGWDRLGSVERLASIADNANGAAKELLNARREEKNFTLRGFTKYGSDTKNSVEKWEETRKRMVERLSTLRATRDLLPNERQVVDDAISAANEYAKAFAAAVTARNTQDKALDGWRTNGWEVTRNIDTVANDVVKPAIAAADKSQDSRLITDWAKIDSEFNSQVIRPFLLLRTTAVYALLTKAEKEWDAYSVQLEKAKNGAAKWADMVKTRPELRKAADAITGYLSGYETAGKAFWASATEVRDSDAIMVTQSRVIGDNCEQLRASVTQRLANTKQSAHVSITFFTFGGLAIGFALAAGTTRMITRPIRACVKCIEGVAEGRLEQEMPAEFLARRDEIGGMANALTSMTKSLRQTVAGIADNSKRLTSATMELSVTGTQLSSGAEETAIQSAQVAAAAEELATNMSGMAASSEQMSTNVRVVASAVEELTSSISEIAKSAEQAAGVANTAAELVAASNTQIGGLGNAANEIGKVLETIQEIAEQTNLLALNATIEAARAGDAGKGFAVVASEVKELAKQTSMATEDIRKRIETIQGAATLAVRSVGDISETIQHVNELSRTIASAVEEQSITTKEIAKNVSESSTVAQTVARAVAESASASREITQGMASVDVATKDTAQGAARTHSAGDETWKVVESLCSHLAKLKTNTSDFDGNAVRNAHAAWISRLSGMITGTVSLHANQVTDHTACEFGKWYYGQGAKQYGNLPAFKALEEPHSCVHRTARTIVELYHNGRKAESAKILAGLAPTVADLLRLIDQLETITSDLGSCAARAV